MAAEALRWTDCERTGEHAADGWRADRHLTGDQRALSRTARAVGRAPSAGRPAAAPLTDAPLLALFGLPPALAEPVTLIAEILGWRVVTRACGGSIPAQLCIAMLPANTGEASPILAWSSNNILNELISHEALSIMEQPLCVFRLEALLQRLGRPEWAAG